MSHPLRRRDFVSLFRIISSHRLLLITAVVMFGLAGVVISRSYAFKASSSGSAAPTVALGQESHSRAYSKKSVDVLEFAGLRHHAAPLNPASPFAPTVTATKTDSLFTDVDGDLQADPGDTLQYTVNIGATVDDATGVSFTDTVDPNTTFVPGSLTATPVAVDDSYSALGNVRISVPAPGVLGNDFAGVPSGTASAPATSTNGGNVAMNADGSFTYNPPAGFEGSDTFTYTLTNAAGSNSGTVTITVSGMIWFINNTASCPCDGRLTNPFNTLAAFAAVNNGAGNNPAANDNIFLYESAIDYVGPVTLLNGQRFIGQDATASLSTITGLTPPTFSDPLPAMNSGNGIIVNVTSAGNSINVASGNTLRGFTGGNSVSDISGTSFGTLTIADVTLNGTGQALNLTTGTLAATFDSISSTNSATTGLSLTSVAGSLTSPSTTITNPAGIGVDVNTSSGSLSFGNTSSTLSGSTGVSLLTNTGAITFGSLAIAPDANQRGLLATDNSGVITSTGGAITSSGAIAVQITRAAGTSPLAISQASVSATGGTNGIVLTNTSGSFTVTGDGSLTRNGSGGTITAVLDDAIALTNASNVTLQSMNLTNNGDTAPGTLAIAESTAGDQTVQISGGSGVVLSGVLIQNPTASGILVLNLGGTNRVNSDSRITLLASGNRHGIYVNNVNTNMSLFEFKNSQIINVASASSSFFFANTGTSNMTLDVKGSTFEDLDNQAITAAGGGVAATTGTLTSIIGGPNAADRNFFQNAKNTGENNVGVLVNNGAVHTGTVQNNLFDNVAENGLTANTSIIRTQNSGGKLTAVVADNTIQNINYTTGGRHIIGHVFSPAVFNAADFSDLRFSGNTVTGVTYTGTNREFTFIDYAPTASGGDIKILNNNFSMTGADAQQAFELRFRQATASTVDLLVDGNTGNVNTTAPYLDIDSEAAATVNATVTNNNFTNPNGVPGRMIDVASETATSSLCGNISGNTINAGTGTIALQRLAGNMTITQASAAAVAAANGIPAGNVVVTGAPTFGVAPCSLPTNALMSSDTSAESMRISVEPDTAQNDILFAERNEGPGDNRVTPLSPAGLSMIVSTAIAKWEDAGVSASDLSRIRAATFEVADLPEGQLAVTNSGRITVDLTGAGYGWFYDMSPADDLEFELQVLNRQREALESSSAHSQMDLLTVVMRQLGSLIGNDKRKSNGWLMQNTLAPGIRRSPVSTRRELSKATPSSDAKLKPAGTVAKPTVTPKPQSKSGSYQQLANLDDRRARALKHHAAFTPRATASSLLADVMLNIGTLPAGESVTITFNVTVDDPFTGGSPQVSNQGTVSGSNFADVLTDDPTVGGAADPTVTPIDLPDVSVAVSPSSVGEDGATNLVYTFTRDGSPASALTVNFSIGGTADFGASPNDYTQTGAATFTPPSGTVTFDAGNSTATVTINPETDTTVETDETVVLTVTSGTGYEVGAPPSASGTITNDDTDVSVAVSPSSVTEDGAGNLVYTFTRVGVVTNPLTVNFSIALGGNNAVFPVDYSQSGAASYAPPVGTVTFGAGLSTATVTIDPNPDAIVEPDETVIFTVSSGAGYNVSSPGSATGTITNEDADVSVTVAPGSATEDGATNLVYTFTRTGFTLLPATVNFSVGGTAVFSSGDYTQTGAATYSDTSGTVVFGAGDSTATVTIDPSADLTVEPDETVILTVTSGIGYNVGSPASATGTITNDDTDVSVAVSPGSVAEDGATNLVYTFTRNSLSAGALTVNFSVGGSAGFPGDYSQSGAATYTSSAGTVTFGAASFTATVTIDPSADITVEPDETVILTVTSGVGYNVGSPSAASGTITNDDTDVSVAVSPASVFEDGATNLVYTFTRNSLSAGALTVNFSVGGSAGFPGDYSQSGAASYTSSAGTVTFGAASFTATVTVDPSVDTTIETDETVILTLTSGAGYNVSSPSSATGTIATDDADVSVTVAPAAVTEDGATNLVYTFTRTGFIAGSHTVNFSVGGTATFGPSPDDYTQTGAATYTTTSGSVTFIPGSPTATVTVNPEADITFESDETVVITLTAGASYNVVSPSSATGTILNDDTLVSVAVAPSSTAEGGANLVYTFTRTGPPASALTVNYSVGGSASFPSDYSQSGSTTFTPPTATVTFGAGLSTATVTVTPLIDCTVEGSETVVFTVTPGTGYGVGSPSSATGTITNVPDSTPPTITLIPNVNMTLWPPNHQYESIAVTDFVASASDNCDPSVNINSVTILKITSDEAENGGGDGNTLNDIIIGASCKTAQLRSERNGGGDGRVYTITFKVKDSFGNFSTATTQVTVRKNPNTPAVDSGTQYTVNSICP